MFSRLNAKRKVIEYDFIAAHDGNVLKIEQRRGVGNGHGSILERS